ncbi:VOC family protein [Bacillus horti]|uniref:Enzyme related to lactoylglutathione lyase n=1 Tax=Caldalkalibacillus horti TaxID=77523 RepID=A0ABT9VY36_9BACI|nr:VOC family protein [Bacillus horti]MDQ0165906.1 putative enzyme related to lactoylglutathione lyase [Bacillus horti]
MNNEGLKTELQEEVKTKPLLKKVHCNYLPVSDLKKAVDWYIQYFSVKQLEANDKILVLGSGQWLFLLESKTKENANFYTDHWDGENYEMFSLTFEVEDIIQLHQSLQHSGAYVGPLVDHGSCGLQFVFKDLDGNKFNAWQDNVR